MAHAAPRTRGAIERAGTTDVFSARTHRAAKVVAPVLLGVLYGYWAAANRRYGGPITVENFLFGFLTGLVFALVFMALLALAPKLRRELHAVLWAAFSGIAVGFLVVQAASPGILRSVALGLAVMAGVFLMMFYRFYTHEDATGRRVG
jgi:drug/metabolite transporter (DMT)-like permease